MSCDVGGAGEYHGNNPEMSKLLHKAVREKNESAYTVYQQYLAKRPVNVNHFSNYYSCNSGVVMRSRSDR
jgi:hypothetical protein